MRRRLALYRGVQREQDFFHLGRARAFDQLGDGEVLGPNAVERRQGSAKHVIEPVQHVRALERPQIADLLDHADQ
jgi:hypothetical protein